MAEIIISQSGYEVPDTRLRSANPTATHGSATTMPIGTIVGKSIRVNRGMFNFPLDAIASGAIINSAKLVIYVSVGAAISVAASVNRMTRPEWVESTASWQRYNIDSDWTTAGGDFTGTDAVPWTLPTSTGFHEITGLEDLVVDGMNNRDDQLIILLKRTSEALSTSEITIHTGENSSDIPHLVVDFTPIKNVSFGPKTNIVSGIAGSINLAPFDPNKFVAVYQDETDSSHGTAKIGFVDNFFITYGDETEFLSDMPINPAVSVLDSSGFVVAYGDSANSDYGTVKLGTTDGTDIAFGTGFVYESGISANNEIVSLSASGFVVFYRKSTLAGGIRVGTIDGIDVAFGEENLAPSGFLVDLDMISLNASSVIITYRDALTIQESVIRAGVVSGTTVTFGDAISIGGTTPTVARLTKTSSSGFVVNFLDLGDGKTRTGTFDGTDVVLGDLFTYTEGLGIHDLAALNESGVIFQYGDGDDSDHGKLQLGVIYNDDQMVFGEKHEYLETGSSGTSRIERLSDNSFVFAYDDPTDTTTVIRIGNCNEQISNSCDLFISAPSGISASGDLFIHGHDVTTTSGDLFIHGHKNIPASGDILFGPESEFASSGGSSRHSVASFDPSTFVVAYRDNSDSDHGTAKIGTVDGADILFGSESEFANSGAIGQTAVTFLNANTFVVAYADIADSTHGKAKIGTISGTSIIFGEETEYASGPSSSNSVATLSSSGFVVLYRDDADSGHGTARIGVVSGITITFGPEEEFLSSGSSIYNSVASFSESGFVVAYQNVTDSFRGLSRIGTISGTTITFGTDIEFASTASHISVASFDNSTFVIGYRENAPGLLDGHLRIGQIDGTDIVFGTEKTFSDGGNFVNNIDVATFDSSIFVVIYEDGNDSDHGTAKVGTISGTDIALGKETEFLSTGSSTHNAVASLDPLHFVVAYRDNTDSGHGTVKIGHLPPHTTSHDIFLQGHIEVSTSGDIFIYGKDVATTSGNLFVHGHEDFSASGDLFIGGLDSVSGVSPPTLFIHGHETVDTSGDLFINGHEVSSTSGDLFIHGFDSTSASGDLFIGGIGAIDSISTSGDLFIHGHKTTSGSHDLFTTAFDTNNSNIDLYIQGFAIQSGQISLFIDGLDEASGIVPPTLFIHGLDIDQTSGDLFILGSESLSTSGDLFIGVHDVSATSGDLFIHGSNPSFASGNLFILGNGFVSLSGDMFISGSGLIPINDSITLFINGFEPRPPVVCPIPSASDSIQITDTLIGVYQSSIDSLINQIGKNIILEFDPILTPCPNCLYDTARKRSTGVYKTSGPRPFGRGRKCPYCKGKGLLETAVTKCIKALIQWDNNEEEEEDFDIAVSQKNGSLMLKTFLTDVDDIARAKTAIVNGDILDRIKLRVKRIRGPYPIGLKEDRYCISFWELL